jgi:hypothetical protein
MVSGVLLLLLMLAAASLGRAEPVVTWTLLDDSSLQETLDAHRIVVLAGCTSETSCENLGSELSRAAKILGRVAQEDTSMALGSVALHKTEATAEIARQYRFAAVDSAASDDADESAEPRCETKVVINGLETDFGLTDDGSDPLVSNLARGLVTAIMREIVPGAKALEENAGLVKELTAANFDEVVAQTKKDGQPMLINFYQPPVRAHARLPRGWLAGCLLAPCAALSQ